MYLIARKFPRVRRIITPVFNLQTSSFVTEALLLKYAINAAAAITVVAAPLLATKVFYRLGSANTLIWKTGMGIKNTKISRNAWVFPPFHDWGTLTTGVRDYQVNLTLRTKLFVDVKIKFLFTIGTKVNDELTNRQTITEMLKLAGYNYTQSDFENLIYNAQNKENNNTENAKKLKEIIKTLKPLTDKQCSDLLEKVKYEYLEDYAKYLSGINYGDLHNNVLSVITGEARGLAANMDIDKIYADRDEFRRIVWDGVNIKLKPLGLFVHNANIESISQDDGYFDDKQKYVLANAKARGEAAEAEASRFAAEKKAEADIKITQYEANVVEEQQKSIQRQKIAEFEATGNYEIRQAEMQKKVEERKLEQQTMAENVNTLSKARARAAEIVKTNEGLRDAAISKAMERKTNAEGLAIAAQFTATEVARIAQGNRDAYIAKMEGDVKGIKIKAEAEANALIILADANLKAELKRAQGVQANLDAEAKGNKNLIDAFSGDNEVFIKDSLIKKGQLVEITEANAKAIKDAIGQVTIWDTNSGGFADVIKNIVAGLNQLKDQTGINPLGIIPDFTPKDKSKKT